MLCEDGSDMRRSGCGGGGKVYFSRRWGYRSADESMEETEGKRSDWACTAECDESDD